MSQGQARSLSPRGSSRESWTAPRAAESGGAGGADGPAVHCELVRVARPAAIAPDDVGPGVVLLDKMRLRGPQRGGNDHRAHGPSHSSSSIPEHRRSPVGRVATAHGWICGHPRPPPDRRGTPILAENIPPPLLWVPARTRATGRPDWRSGCGVPTQRSRRATTILRLSVWLSRQYTHRSEESHRG